MRNVLAFFGWLAFCFWVLPAAFEAFFGFLATAPFCSSVVVVVGAVVLVLWLIDRPRVPPEGRGMDPRN